MKDAQVQLGGEIWTIRWVTRRSMPKKTWGLCYWDEKLILVRKDLSHKNRVDTLIHEMRHAQHRIMFEAEDFINQTSTELMEGLFATGIVDTSI